MKNREHKINKARKNSVIGKLSYTKHILTFGLDKAWLLTYTDYCLSTAAGNYKI